MIAIHGPFMIAIHGPFMGLLFWPFIGHSYARACPALGRVGARRHNAIVMRRQPESSLLCYYNITLL